MGGFTQKISVTSHSFWDFCMRRAGDALHKGAVAYNSPLQLGSVKSKPSFVISFSCGCIWGIAITLFSILAWLLQVDAT